MKKTTGYTFKHSAKEIIITKAFDKAVRDINSKEYNELSRLVKDFPTYKIVIKTIKKKENKKSYSGLTIDEMKRFINTRSDKEQDTFKKVLLITEGKKGKYAIVKKWFLDCYKEEYDAELEKLALVAELKKYEEEVEVEAAENSEEE
jgi:hypothetical protein